MTDFPYGQWSISEFISGKFPQGREREFQVLWVNQNGEYWNDYEWKNESALRDLIPSEDFEEALENLMARIYAEREATKRDSYSLM